MARHNVLYRLCRILTFAAVLGYGLALAAADDPTLLKKHHPWGGFQPGAWKMVRVVTETLDQQGVVVNTSVNESKTFLTGVSKDGVTLELQATVEVAGKRFETEPQTVKQSFYGEPANVEVKADPAVDTEIEIDGRRIPCRELKLHYAMPANGQRTTTTIDISDKVAPYVLRRENVTTEADGKTVVSSTSVEVKSLDLPWRAAGEIKNAALVKTVTKHAKGSVETWSVTSNAIPGGVITHGSKELDANGRVLRRSTLELVDYGLECEEERLGPFHIKRRPRFR